MRHISLSTLFLAIGVLFTGALSAQQRTEISIQGTLKDGSGLAVSDGQRTATFRLYDVATGGDAVWEEEATIEVIGGVYSHNLGSVTPLVTGDFASTLYMGVTYGGTELSPRTQMTYAPYALSVDAAQQIAQQGCSGQVGDIKYSILNPTQFAEENGECWVAMDGGDITGTRLAGILDQTNVPDMSGLFIRATEYNDGNDPGRGAMAAATLQEDAFQNHEHFLNIQTSENGNHTHRYRDYFDSDDHSYGDHLEGGERGENGDNEAQGDEGARRKYRDWTVDHAGNHRHSVNGWTAGADRENGTVKTDHNETRSKNMNFFIYIRVD